MPYLMEMWRLSIGQDRGLQGVLGGDGPGTVQATRRALSCLRAECKAWVSAQFHFLLARGFSPLHRQCGNHTDSTS